MSSRTPSFPVEYFSIFPENPEGGYTGRKDVRSWCEGSVRYWEGLAQQPALAHHFPSTQAGGGFIRGWGLHVSSSHVSSVDYDSGPWPQHPADKSCQNLPGLLTSSRRQIFLSRWGRGLPWGTQVRSQDKDHFLFLLFDFVLRDSPEGSR